MKNLFQGVVTLLVVITLIYTYARSQTVLRGPTLNIYEPLTTMELDNPLLIRGQVKNANFLTINDAIVDLENDGSFSIIKSYTPGYALLEFYVSNKHGKEKTIYKHVTIKEN